MNRDYKKQAEDFLKSANATLKIERAEPQKAPLWCKEGEKHGINYICTLETPRGKYTFDFWDSIKKAEIIEAVKKYSKFYSGYKKAEDFRNEDFIRSAGIKISELRTNGGKEMILKTLAPSDYTILACMSPLYEDTFDDFCASFGYDNESITALKTWEACNKQDRMLRKIFTSEELERLQEIQ